MKVSSFGHDLKHLVEAFHVDFRRLGTTPRSGSK